MSFEEAHIGVTSYRESGAMAPLCLAMLRTPFLGTCLFLGLALLVPPPLGASPPQTNGEEIVEIIGKMKAAVAFLKDYQTETVVREYREGRLVDTKRFLYSFKQPNHIRIDLETPHPGMVLIYPDEDGKVVVEPFGWARFLRLHLPPDSGLLMTSAGQRIDQTDLGLLVQNMAHSLTDRRHGEIMRSEEDGLLCLEVMAENHFHPNVLTRYRFLIAEKRWLPVEVQERTPEGVLQREVIFRNLRTSISIPDTFFQIDGRNGEDGRSHR
jgi:outer membrane lipoprotein-sorting protein